MLQSIALGSTLTLWGSVGKNRDPHCPIICLNEGEPLYNPHPLPERRMIVYTVATLCCVKGPLRVCDHCHIIHM